MVCQQSHARIGPPAASILEWGKCKLSAPCALLRRAYPNDRTAKPVDSAREAGSWFDRGQMLSRSGGKPYSNGGSVRIVSFARAQKISLSAIECSFVLCEKSEEMSYHGAAPYTPTLEWQASGICPCHPRLIEKQGLLFSLVPQKATLSESACSLIIRPPLLYSNGGSANCQLRTQKTRLSFFSCR